jgi:hypothetical protein
MRAPIDCSDKPDAATTNVDGYIKDVDPKLLLGMQVTCGLCWVCFLLGAKAAAGKGKSKK